MYYVVRFMQFYLYVCFPPNKLGHESSTLEVQKAIPLGQGIKARIDVSCNLVAFRQYCQTATYVQPLSSAFKQKQVLRRRLSYDESGRMVNILLGDGNSNIFDVHPEIGEDSHFDYYFSNRLVQPPTRLGMLNFCKKISNNILWWFRRVWTIKGSKVTITYLIASWLESACQLAQALV